MEKLKEEVAATAAAAAKAAVEAQLAALQQEHKDALAGMLSRHEAQEVLKHMGLMCGIRAGMQVATDQLQASCKDAEAGLAGLGTAAPASAFPAVPVPVPASRQAPPQQQSSHQQQHQQKQKQHQHRSVPDPQPSLQVPDATFFGVQEDAPGQQSALQLGAAASMARQAQRLSSMLAVQLRMAKKIADHK